MVIYEKVDDFRSSKSNTVRFSNMELVNQHDFRNDDGVSNPMRLFKVASACVALGLFTSVVSAEDKRQRTDRRGSDARQGGPTVREPAEMVSKMLSEFDSDADNMLSVGELTAMFTAMRERSVQARSGQAKSGQSRAGQSRANPVRRISGAKNGSNVQSRLSSERAMQPKSERGDSAQSNKFLRDKSEKSRNGRGNGQSGGPEQRERLGGTRPDRPNAE